MEPLGVKDKQPQDLVAIFHASFHPTQANVVDWSLKASDSLDLSNVEFSCLPSGLHSVEQDVVYFTKDEHQGVCVFRRRQTAEHGQRGFRLSSLGILLAKSARPRPWRHVTALKELVNAIYTSLEDRDALDLMDSDLDRARAFFEERQVRRADLGGAGTWDGWSREVRDTNFEVSPTSHLLHLLRILGPSCLTMYKHVLGRRRILIYTLPPVEAACILCQVAADMCFDDQLNLLDTHPTGSTNNEGSTGSFLKGRSKEPTRVLGMVTLNDIDKLQRESKSGRGWIACTTDLIFKEKPECYDLFIDLTPTITNKSSRPAFSVSKSAEQSNPRGSPYRLHPVRFTWSDVKLWAELDKILQSEPDNGEHNCCSPPSANGRPRPTTATAWSDMWRVYEDVCVVCAGIWMGPWRNSSNQGYWPVESSSPGHSSIRLNGEEDFGLQNCPSKTSPYVRNVGMGIEGRPSVSSSSEPTIVTNRSSRNGRRTSVTSLLTWVGGRGSNDPSTASAHPKDASADSLEAEILHARRERQILITLSLLGTFATNTHSLLSRLACILPERTAHSAQISNSGVTIVLTPKDLASFDLGPLSGPDGHFVEWIAEEYGSGHKVVVKRGWRDVVALLLGLG